MYFVIIFLIIIDQILKFIFFKYNINFLIFIPVRNYGISRGLDMHYIVILVFSIIFFGLLVYMYKTKFICKWCFAFIIAGGVSNFIDRLVFGYVRDWIDFFGIFVFNLADLYISIGFLLFVLYNLPIRK